MQMMRNSGSQPSNVLYRDGESSVDNSEKGVNTNAQCGDG